MVCSLRYMYIIYIYILYLYVYIYIYSVINVDWKDTLDVLCKLYMEMVFAAIRCLLASPYEPQTIEASQPSQLTIQISQQSTQQSIYPPPKLLQTLPPPNIEPHPPTLPNRNKSAPWKLHPWDLNRRERHIALPKPPKCVRMSKQPGGCPAVAHWGWQFGKCHASPAATNLGVQNFNKTPLLGQYPPKIFRWQHIFYQPQETKGRPLDIVTPKWKEKWLTLVSLAWQIINSNLFFGVSCIA